MRAEYLVQTPTFLGLRLTCSGNSPLQVCMGSCPRSPDPRKPARARPQRPKIKGRGGETAPGAKQGNEKTGPCARPGAWAGGRPQARHPHVSCQHPLSRWPSPPIIPSDPDKVLDPSLTTEVRTEESHAWLKSRSLPTSRYPACSQFKRDTAPPLPDPSGPEIWFST